jgi:outer membrane protein assembly factor BamB
MGTGSFNDSEGFWAWRFTEPPHRQKGKTGLCWTLHAIDLTTGKSVWEYLTGNNVCGDPVIANGNLYFNSRDGRIYCLSPVKEGETAIPDSPDKTPAAPVAEVKKLFEEKSKQFAPGTAWPMAGGTPQRTGIADAIITLPLMESWQFDTGGRILTAAAIAEGRVFVGSLSGRIFAIDLNSGAKIWEIQTGGEIRSVPAIADDVVYCGSDDAIFRAMDAATGKIKWSYNCGGPIQASPAVVGGTIVFGANDGHIYMLNRHTGKKLWSFHGDYPLVQAPPVVNGEQIFAAQWVDWAYALNAYTGEEQWRTCVPITIESLHSFGDKFWLRSAYQFAEFDPTNGKRLRIGNAIYGYNSLAFTTNAFVMTGTRSAEVVKLDQPDAKFDKNPNLTDVKVLKSDRMLGWPKLGSAGTPLIMNDKIAFASMYGELVVTDFTGKVLWQFKLGSTSHASPTIANSVLVVGCDDGKLYAFKEKKD